MRDAYFIGLEHVKAELLVDQVNVALMVPHDELPTPTHTGRDVHILITQRNNQLKNIIMQWHLYQDIFKRMTFNPHTGHKYAWKCQIFHWCTFNLSYTWSLSESFRTSLSKKLNLLHCNKARNRFSMSSISYYFEYTFNCIIYI